VLITKDTCDTVGQIIVSDPALFDGGGNISNDHFAISFSLSFPRPCPIQKEVEYRKLCAINMDDFKQSISEAGLDGSGNVNYLVMQYNNKLRGVLDIHAPLCKKTITVRPDSPWYTEELHKEKHKKRKLERQWMRSKLAIHHQLYSNNAV
jgi:hypothetical protein